VEVDERGRGSHDIVEDQAVAVHVETAGQAAVGDREEGSTDLKPSFSTQMNTQVEATENGCGFKG